MPGPTVLLVEDEFLIRLPLVEALTAEGFNVIEAATGDEALAALKTHPELALLVTDIQLPGEIDGFAVVRAARATTPALPVIHVTGHPAHQNSVLIAPHDAFVSKPYLPSDICVLARRLTRP